MLTPAATDASSTYYKIGGTVTLSWSYTSVQVTPSSIVVQAYCPTNKYLPPGLIPLLCPLLFDLCSSVV